MKLQIHGMEIKKLGISFFLLVSIIFLSGLSAQGQQVRGTDVHQWVGQHLAKGKIPPFSFMYGGKSSNSFLRNWQFKTEK